MTAENTREKLAPQLGPTRQRAAAYYVEVKIGGVIRDALVDTGATVTMVTSSLLEEAPLLRNLLRPSTVSYITGISGRQVPLLGEFNVAIQLGNIDSASHRVVVLQDGHETFPCVLGLDFLEQYGLTVNTVDRCLYGRSTTGKTLTIPLRILHVEHAVCRVVSSERISIPARTCQFVAVKVPKAEDGVDGCIEPIMVDGSEVLVARSLNRIEAGGTFVEVANWTGRDIWLQKGQRLGSFEVMTEGIRTATVDTPIPSSSELPGDLFDLTNTDLTELQRNKVRSFLKLHAAIIGRDEYDLGCTNTVEHVIDVDGAVPIKQRWRRFPAPLRKEVQTVTADLLKRGIIEPSISAWSSPLVPIRKKNGTLRLCVDYRAVNAKTKKDSFPLPNMSDAVSQFRDGVYFSSLTY